MVVERVVVLGLPGGPEGFSAVLLPEGWAAAHKGEVPLQAAPGPIYNRPGLEQSALVVRRPRLPVGKSWGLRVQRGSVGPVKPKASGGGCPLGFS